MDACLVTQNHAAAVKNGVFFTNHADCREHQYRAFPMSDRITGKGGPQFFLRWVVATVGVDARYIRTIFGNDPGLLRSDNELVDIGQCQQSRKSGRRTADRDRVRQPTIGDDLKISLVLNFPLFRQWRILPHSRATGASIRRLRCRDIEHAGITLESRPYATPVRYRFTVSRTCTKRDKQRHEYADSDAVSLERAVSYNHLNAPTDLELHTNITL